MRLDDKLAGAHLTRAILYMFHDRNYRAAAAEFQRSIALDPNDPSAWLFRSWYYLGMNQPDSALISIRTARKLDPNSSIIHAREGTALYFTGRLAEAETVLRNAMAADSGNVFARQQLVAVYADDGQCDAARHLAAQIPPTPSPYENSFAPYARARCGDVAGATKFTDALEARAARGGYVDPYAIARVYAALGDTARAWPWLDRAVTSNAWNLWGIHSDPAFKAFWNDARFQALDARARPR